jgi:5-methylcytosine-specific restriction endonuclease McrA
MERTANKKPIKIESRYRTKERQGALMRTKPTNSHHNLPHYFVDEESAKNERNQDIAEENEKQDLSNYGASNGQATQSNHLPLLYKKKKSVKKISNKQSEINKLYKLTCIDMDYTTEPACTGCLKYQGGDIKLSHSHIISREDCKRIGKPELIYDRENLTFHCMTFGDNKGCHNKHESPVERNTLNDYEKNMQYIKSVSEELYLKYTNKK